jgi:hypothetical protein
MSALKMKTDFFFFDYQRDKLGLRVVALYSIGRGLLQGPFGPMFQVACSKKSWCKHPWLGLQGAMTPERHNKRIPYRIQLFQFLIAVDCISVRHCQLFHKKNHSYHLD